MVILRRFRRAIIATLVVALVIVPAFSILPVEAYSPYCVTDACHKAEDDANNARNAASNANRTAATLEAEVARLDAQIAAIEAQVAANEALARDLSAQIAAQEAKLKQERSALAALLVETHFENNQDTVIILAGSESISDLAEKQAREQTAKTQISLFAESIRQSKEQLEQQKSTVDSLIAEDELRAAEAATLKANKNTLITKYKNDYAAYQSQAIAAEAIANEEIRNELQRSLDAGNSVAGIDTYPYRSVCNRANGERFATRPYTYSLYVPALGYNPGLYGGVVCQCTGYAGWKAFEYTKRVYGTGTRISSWGDAGSWAGSAKARGYSVGTVPRKNSVAVYAFGNGMIYGHVMWVEEVISNYSIVVSDYNWNPYVYRSTQMSTYPGQLQYIYF